nr:hypothetical protein Y57A10A.b - Caenorhabditis elegans [Caenorhabditis elegans]
MNAADRRMLNFLVAKTITKKKSYSKKVGLQSRPTEPRYANFGKACRTREHGIAQLDGRNRICKYESEDGTLQLGTAHSESAKRCSASDSDQGGAKIAKITEEPQITQHPTKSEENYESQIAQLQKLWNNDEYVGSRHEIPSKGPEFKFEHKRDNDLENPDLFFRKPKSEIDLDEIWHDDDEIEHSISSFRGNTINFHDFLKKFRKFLCYLEIPELDGLKSRINISIETTSDEVNRIVITGSRHDKFLLDSNWYAPLRSTVVSNYCINILEFADLHKTFETFFFGINRKIRSTAAANSMPLNVFLIKFKCFLLGLGSPQILDFQHMVQAEIDDPTVVNKILHLNDICQAVSFLFSIIAH